jgi:GT2 family glycosyltransferase
MKQIILFDLDGTLINSTEAILESFYYSFNKNKDLFVFDQDDKAFPEMIEELYYSIENVRERKHEYVVAVPGVVEIDENGKIINERPIIGENFSLSKLLPNLIVRNRGCRTGGMIVDTKIFKKIGGFDENIKSAMDWELCLRLAMEGYGIYFLNKPLLF